MPSSHDLAKSRVRVGQVSAAVCFPPVGPPACDVDDDVALSFGIKGGKKDGQDAENVRKASNKERLDQKVQLLLRNT